MKKKLIAIVTSLAMVATMVPATVFAAASPKTETPAVQATVDLMPQTTIAKYESNFPLLSTYKELAGKRLNDGITSSVSGNKITLSGTVPYIKGYDAYAANAEGNFIAFWIEAEKNNDVAGWTWSSPTTLDDGSAGYLIEKADLWSGSAPYAAIQILKLNNSKKAEEYTVHYVNGDYTDPAGTVASGTVKKVTALPTEGIVSSKTFTVDISGLKLQTEQEADTAAIAKEVADVKELVAKIPAVDQITEADKKAIDAAAAKYESVSSDAKKQLGTEHLTIVAAQNALAALETSKDVDNVIALIKKIPDSITTKAADAAAITAADTAYAALSTTDKGNVTNAKKLTDTKAALTAVTAIDTNLGTLETALKVDHPEYYKTTSTKSAVAAAKAELDKLTNDQVGYVGNYNVYKNVTAIIADYTKQVDDMDALLLKLKDITSIDAEQAEIDKVQAQLDAADEAYDAMNPAALQGCTTLVKTDVFTGVETLLNAAKQKLQNQKAADWMVEKIKALPSTITLNDMAIVKAAELAWAGEWATSPTAIPFTEDGKAIDPSQLDNIKALAATALGKTGANDTAIINALNADLTAATTALTSAISSATAEQIAEAYQKNCVDTLPATPTVQDRNAITVAQALKTDLTKANGNTAFEQAKNKVDAVDNAVKAIETANQIAFDDVKNKVAAFYPGNTLTVLRTDKAAIEAARAAYDALTDEQKKLDSDTAIASSKSVKEALEAAEKKLAEVEAAIPNRQAADAIILAIEKLMPTKNLTLADKDAVDVAAKQYADASKEVKALVDAGYIKNDDTTKEANKALDDAVEAINKLIADDVKTKIEALTALTGNEAKAEIDAAAEATVPVREAYNNLTDAQKALVTNANKLDSIEAGISAAKVTYTDGQIAGTLDINIETLTKEQAEQLETVYALTTDWLTATEESKLAEANYKTFKELYEAYTKAVKDLSTATVVIEDQAYTGNALTPTAVVTDRIGNTVAESEYVLSYKNNVEVGTATATITAVKESGYNGSKEVTFQIDQADIKAAATISKIADKAYTKKAITPAVTVKAGSKTLTNGTDYTVSYAKNTNIGQAAVTIKGTGNYKGTITISFIIKPAKGKVTKLTAGKKQITVSYETQKAQSGKTGYRIICKTTGVKATGINTTAAGKKTVSKLKSGKTYQVKVRAYKTIGGTKYWGSYSTVKKVKVK